MSERESSTASSVDFYETDKKSNTPPLEPQVGPPAAKRKAEEALFAQEKKRKLESSTPFACVLQSCAGLPPAVWQHAFLSCSLFDLGRLLQVNRSFRSYLLDVRNVPLSKSESGALRLLKSDSLWASARNALSVKPPKPLRGFSELQMWQLAWSKRCQFCRKEKPFTPGEKLWQKGPGSNGVRTVWSFGIRSCGPCLMQRCQTDASLLFSNASALRSALSFAFITNDYNYIPAHTLQATTTPAGVEITKFYFKDHVEDITTELNDALGLGPAAAEEWSKGLDARGTECMKVVENWERWIDKYQSKSDLHDSTPADSAPSPTAISHKDLPKSPMRRAQSPIIHAPVPSGKYSLVLDTTVDGGTILRRDQASLVPSLTAAAIVPRYVQSRPPTVPQQYTPQPIPGGNVHLPRGESNLHDANEAKANRKSDIERRCQQMEPPIPPNVLRHMDSFKAALHISQPMTEVAWSVLQPRLIAQLPAAQQAELNQGSRHMTSSRAADRRLLDVNSKEAKEAMDREWEESQRPVRDKLNNIADIFINRDWDHGRAVTYENSPKFAVDLLVYVRRSYYASSAGKEGTSSQEHQNATAEDEKSNRARLVLDNMKWVYDNKVKPLTEQHRKELFLCYGNGCEGNTRFYGFEGVIQHFGAKHTNAFSVGNVIVVWREVEWPVETPFHPDPISVKHTYHAAALTGNHTGYGAYYGGFSRAGTSTPHVQPHLPQASPGPYPYGGHYNGPFAPPQMSSAAMTGYDYGQSYGTPLDPFQYPSMAPPAYGGQSGSGYLASPALANSAIVPPPAALPEVSGPNDTLHKPDETSHRNILFDKQVSTVIGMAQDIWKHTSGIKDLPNSLRVYILLQRVISKFHIEFNHEPSLDHFTDAFSNHEIPRALRNAPGLSCKPCQEESSHYLRQEERRTYTVLNLLSHFKSQHSVPQIPGYGTGHHCNSLDWKENLMELPSDRFISGLIHAPGMDDNKLLMIATVFPRLFPTPLPKIGAVDNKGTPPLSTSVVNDLKDGKFTVGTPAVLAEDSGPSSVASPHADSHSARRPEDEYDPQRPALSATGSQTARSANRKHSYYRGSSPANNGRPRYYTDPRYYLPRQSLDDQLIHSREYLEYAAIPRRIREPGPHYGEYHDRRPIYQENEQSYDPSRAEGVFVQPREGVHVHDYRPSSRHVRYLAEGAERPEFRYIREPRLRDSSPSEGKSAADRFLDEFIPGRPVSNEQTELAPPLLEEPQAAGLQSDPNDGSRYTPPPPNIPPIDDVAVHIRSMGPDRQTAPSTVSNGSRYEEYRSGGRQVPTPDSARAPKRPGPHRRRDKHHDHAPSRYSRYMSVARDEPYSRAASTSRSQSKRYERYEQQRRRIDQQETPQPKADQDQPSRDHSVDLGPAEDAPRPLPQPPRDYVSVQDRLQSYSAPRYRHSEYPEESRGPSPVYVDQYGHPIHGYEIIRVPHDGRAARGSYIQHSGSARYADHEPEGVRYVPTSYDRALPQRHEGRPDYMYYEERERLPLARRTVYNGDDAFEPPPPEIKVENAALVPEAP